MSERDVATFVSFCIEQYAKAKEMMPDQVVDLFDRYDVLDYLSEFYDVLHTQGHRWLIAEIDEFIGKRIEK